MSATGCGLFPQVRVRYAGRATSLEIVIRETDPVHPVTTARYLRSAVPDATVHVSGTVDEVRTWADRIDEFLS